MMMKKMLSIFICLLLASAAFGSWETVKGPIDYNNPADAVALNATTVLKVSGNTVTKTTNFGESWTDIALPEGVTLRAIDAASETVAYACGDGGLVYKTTNAGDTWTQVGDTANYTINLEVIDVYDADNVFIGGRDGNFLKTGDGGSTWSNTVYGTAHFNGGIAFASLTNGIVFNNGTGGVIHVTNDGGDTWTDYPVTPPLGLTFKRMYCASAVKGTSTFIVGAYNNVVWYSSDGGANWACISEYTFAFDRIVEIKAFDANNFIAASSASDLLVTSDAGATWDTLGVGSGQSCQAIAYSSPTNGMVICSYGQEFTTTDGETFVPLNDWPAISLWGIAFPSERDVVLAGWGGGELSFSDDYGKTFTYPDNYISDYNGNIYEIHFADENTGYFGGSSGMIKKTIDGGQTWEFKDNPMAQQSNKHINMMYIAPNGDIFAGGSSGIIMKSTDEGETWVDLPHNSTQTIYDMRVFGNGMAMIGCGSGQFSVSATTALDSFVMVADYGSQLFRAIDERNGVVIAVSSQGAIWKTTTDALDTLVQVFTEPAGNDFYGVAFVDDNTIYTVGRRGVSYYSVDAGETWNSVTTGVEDTEPTLQHLAYNGYELWAVGQNGTVLKKTIQPRYQVTAHVNMSIQMRKGNFNHSGHSLDIIGSGWHGGIPMEDAEGDSIYSAVLGEYAEGTVLEYKFRRNGANDGTEEGSDRTYTVLAEDDQDIPVVYYDNDTEVSVAGVPMVYELAQNYPNPFNPVTGIKFALPNSGHVTLSVYNVTGRKVAELVNKQMTAGYYNVNFNASMLPSGVYFYRLEAGDFISVKKMTLLK
jgi:photosystem II stability/assembly factor-like uncharacterized protein